MNTNAEIIDTKNINDEDLPAIVSGTYTEIEKLERKYQNANNKAIIAKDAANTVKKVGLFNKGERIKELQDVGKNLAEATEALADAQKLQFEYQKKLSNACRYLFLIGATNMSHCQSIRRELQLKLQGASEEELSEFAQQEIINTINQLKEQERIMQEQSNIIKRLDEQDEDFKELKNKINIQKEDIDARLNDFEEFEEKINSYEHLKDVDEIWDKSEQQHRKIDAIQQDIESKNNNIVKQYGLLDENVAYIKENQEKNHTEFLEKLKISSDKILELSHNSEINKDNIEQEITNLYKKSKIACYILGTTSFIAIVISVLNLLNIL